MTEFEWDCRQRKQLASQYRHKKNGSKSKKCTLPSDYLTQKQLKERCGAVMSYNLSSPMPWGDFKKMPVDIQAEYIINLQTKYGVTANDLSEMFGVQGLTVRRHAETHDLKVEFPRGRTMGRAQRERWEEFLHGACVTPADSETSLSNSTDNQEDENVTLVGGDSGEDCTLPSDSEQSESSESKMKMKKVCLRFDGEIDIDTIANSLRWILGDNPNGSIEINYEMW